MITGPFALDGADLYDLRREGSAMILTVDAPHFHLHTRIKVSPLHGVGVFAIRDIPAGTRLFLGDAGKTVLIPVEAVDAIEEAEIRQMYADFCPVIDGHFVAPANFNQITMGWYLNHSESPNVTVTSDLQFVTSGLIAKGEEVLANYSTYSNHALEHIRRWRASQ